MEFLGDTKVVALFLEQGRGCVPEVVEADHPTTVRSRHRRPRKVTACHGVVRGGREESPELPAVTWWYANDPRLFLARSDEAERESDGAANAAPSLVPAGSRGMQPDGNG